MSTTTPSPKVSNPLAVVVTKVDGTVVQFAGFSAKFIVAHPRLSVLMGFVAGGLIGHFT